MKQKPIYLWVMVSVLYVSGCLWLFFGTLNFEGLNLFMRREDDAYVADCQETALLGSVMAMMPVVCLWLEFRVTGRFGRLRFWLRRYCGCLTATTVIAVFLWFWGHAAIRYPYTDSNSPPAIIAVLSVLILCQCIKTSRRVRITFRKN